MNKYNLYRLSALLYPDGSNSLNRETTIKKIVESFFAVNENRVTSLELLPCNISTVFKLHFTFEEINLVTAYNDSFVRKYDEINCDSDGKPDVLVSLTCERYDYLKVIQETKNIYRHIEEHYKINDDLKNNYTLDAYKELIESFLYKIFIQNISKSRALFNGELNIAELMENIEISDVDKEVINKFLDFDSVEKNKAIFDIGSLAIEFVTLNGHINLEAQLNNITHKTLYLDTNILFRVLGINGERREETTVRFLQRCSETGQKIKITVTTEREMLKTIDYGMQKITRVPANVKYWAPFEDAILNHFFNLKKTSKAMGPEIYQAILLQKYNKLKSELKIEIDMFDYYKNIKGLERKSIDKIADQLAVYKHKYEDQVLPDATNICYIRHLRKGHEKNFNDAMFFFVTADKRLTAWVEEAIDSFPVTVYPSDWLSILLKYVNRTGDDYKSFVNFIKNVIHKEYKDQNIVSDILEGIAEVAEKIENQQFLYNTLIEKDYERIKDIKTREERKEYALSKSKEYLDLDIERLSAEQKLMNVKVNDLQNRESEREVTLSILINENRVIKDKVDSKNSFIKSAESKIRKNEIYFLSLVTLVALFVITFSWFFADWNYNLVIRSVKAVFGKGSDVLTSWQSFVSAVILAILIYAVSNLWHNFYGKKTLQNRLLEKGIDADE